MPELPRLACAKMDLLLKTITDPEQIRIIEALRDDFNRMERALTKRKIEADRLSNLAYMNHPSQRIKLHG